MNRVAIACMATVASGVVGFLTGPVVAAVRPSLELAQGLIEVGQYEPAEKLLSDIEVNSPADKAELAILRGRLLLARGNPVRALEDFEQAAALSLDREGEACLYMAEAKLALGELPQARRDAELALKDDPDLVTALVVIAKSERRAGHAKEGAARLAQLEERRHDDEAVAIALARFQAENQGRAAAIDSLRAFVNAHPEAATAEVALGGLLWSAGQNVDAVRARIAAGERYLAEGKIGQAQAMAYWIKAVDGDGNLERAARGEAAQPAVLPPGPEMAPPKAKAPVSDEPPPPQAAPLAPPPTTELLPNHDAVASPAPPPVASGASPAIAAPGPPIPSRIAMAAPDPGSAPRPRVVPAVALATPEPFPFAPGSNYISGSGVVLEGGRLVVTNRHVIEGMGVIFLRNGTGHVRRAHLVKVSHEDDLALLEIDQPFPEGASIALADLVDPAPGRDAVAMGFPLVDLLGDSQPALTEGIVAKTTGLANDPKTFQITTKINKGNSGGPVFDREGHLMGVTVGQTDAADIYRKDGYLVEDMNIGIKADRILHFLGRDAPPIVPVQARAEIGLEDLYQMMLPRVVLVAAQR